jgi:histidine triad (HIT) family protein
VPTHEPPGYECPFCTLAAGRPTGIGRSTDYVARTDLAMTMVAPRWWPDNPGHALVVPLAHHENLYDLPPSAGHAVHDLVRAVATAMRAAYGCGGVTVRQNNEPVGNQTVWHYHVHVFPRHRGDDLHRSHPLPGPADIGARKRYADLLRAALGLNAG